MQFKQTLWSSGLLTWNLKWSILYCPMLCRRTYGGLCHFKLSILPYYNLIISLYRSLNSNAVISADDVSLKGKSTCDIYWNAIIAVTHIYRFSPMGFLGWGYRLQMLTHLSLSHPPTFSLTHTPQPLYSHNTVIDLVKGPRFIFLCTGDVSIENTSCVWGRKLARQHRMLYAADTMGRGSQWHPAEPVAHNVGLQQVGLKALQIRGGSTAIRCITSRTQEMLASLLVVTQMFKLNKLWGKCAVLYKYRTWHLFFPPTSWLNQSVHWRSVRHIQTNTISHSQQWGSCHLQLREHQNRQSCSLFLPISSRYLLRLQSLTCSTWHFQLMTYLHPPCDFHVHILALCMRPCPTLCTSRCPYRGLSAAISAGVSTGSVTGPAVRPGPCDREQRGC